MININVRDINNIKVGNKVTVKTNLIDRHNDYMSIEVIKMGENVYWVTDRGWMEAEIESCRETKKDIAACQFVAAFALGSFLVPAGYECIQEKNAKNTLAACYRMICLMSAVDKMIEEALLAP